MPTTDAEILARHQPSCRQRARMELAIVPGIIAAASATGYTLEDAEEGPTDDLLGLLFDLDESHLLVKKGGQEVGWILLVFGNSGWDCVSDYTVNLEEFLRPVHELADRLENGLA